MKSPAEIKSLAKDIRENPTRKPLPRRPVGLKRGERKPTAAEAAVVAKKVFAYADKVGYVLSQKDIADVHELTGSGTGFDPFKKYFDELAREESELARWNPSRKKGVSWSRRPAVRKFKRNIGKALQTVMGKGRKKARKNPSSKRAQIREALGIHQLPRLNPTPNLPQAKYLARVQCDSHDKYFTNRDVGAEYINRKSRSLMSGGKADLYDLSSNKHLLGVSIEGPTKPRKARKAKKSAKRSTKKPAKRSAKRARR